MLFNSSKQYLFTDPLEQFENTLIYDLYFFKGLWSFLIITLFVVIFEKILVYYFNESFLNNLIINLIKNNLPVQGYYIYYILSPLFILLFSMNISGLFVFVFTETSVVPVVFLFSFIMFFGFLFTVFDNQRHYFLNFFLPFGTPFAITKFIIFIEIVSYFTRLISLAVRLLANMVSGHILLKILTSFVWIIIISNTFFSFLFFIPWVIVCAVLCLEILIAFLQSYVFIFLNIIFFKEIN